MGSAFLWISLAALLGLVCGWWGRDKIAELAEASHLEAEVHRARARGLRFEQDHLALTIANNDPAGDNGDLVAMRRVELGHTLVLQQLADPETTRTYHELEGKRREAEQRARLADADAEALRDRPLRHWLDWFVRPLIAAWKGRWRRG